MILEAWQIIHFRLLGNDNFLPYGSSIIEPARRIWRQLILIEDAMLVYRIVRSPERRVFKIEMGNIKPEDVPKEMEQIQTRLRRNKIVDSDTGRVDLRYNPLSVDEDYWLPMRDGKGSDISTLPGGQFTGDIEDVQYIQNKLFAALQIPKAYLGYEGDVGSKATLAQEDVRFSRTIQRIQKIVLSELTKIAVIHLYLLGYRDKELIDYEIKMANPSTIAEQQKLELWRMRLEIAGTAQEGMLDKKTIWKDLFSFSNEKMDEMMDEMRADKMFQLELDAMVAPDAEEPAADTGGELPGEEDLPSTLGGEPGGDEELAASKNYDDQNDHELTLRMEPKLLSDDEELDEKRNPGSEGDSAEIAVDKGKDLFNPGEEMYNHVFGSEKQTSSDPFDQRSFSMMIRRPFSEENQHEGLNPVGEFVKDSLEKTKKFESSLDSIDNMLLEIKSRERHKKDSS